MAVGDNPQCETHDTETDGTHVVQPGELAPGRIGLDVALEVHVVAVFDVVRGERRAEPQ